jgi:hypothetical protein
MTYTNGTALASAYPAILRLALAAFVDVDAGDVGVSWNGGTAE